MNFKNLQWGSDRLVIHDRVFRLEYNKDDLSWELGSECFPLIKNKEIMDSYARFFTSRPSFHPRNIVEIGMFGGGSMALWNEIFKPDKLIGIDIDFNKENDYFRRYLAENSTDRTIAAYWNTDQGDKAELERICSEVLQDGIDLVFDDASHLYTPTKHSFEALFPFLRPGGLYIIEDWNWAHTAPFQQETSIWRNETALTQLVFELVEAVGSSRLLANVHIFDGYAVIEKGTEPWEQSQKFFSR